MIKIRFQAVDTLFFRDGSPFNRQELQANVRSVFPPSPTTLIGAIRVAWAKAMGWDGKSQWDKKITNILGTGFYMPETISFNGPYISYHNELLFPVPAHILAKEPKTSDAIQQPDDLVFLKRGKIRQTDIGDVALPTHNSEVEGLKNLNANWWVNTKGLNRILNGKLPDKMELFHSSTLWQIEQRTGNYSRENNSRTTGLMSLYTPQHIRLNHHVELVIFAEGLPIDETSAFKYSDIERQLHTLGGEARLCNIKIEQCSADNFLNISPINEEADNYALIALTPAQLPEGILPGKFIGDGSILSACNSRPVMLGGWDINKPRKLMPHLPAASVLFMKAGSKQKLGNIITDGQHQQWGFGRFVTGIIP